MALHYINSNSVVQPQPQVHIYPHDTHYINSNSVVQPQQKQYKSASAW